MELGDCALGLAFSAIKETFRGFRVMPSLPPGIRLEILEINMSGVRGGYNSEKNVIFLSGKDWCWKTLVHEVLHALSVFLRFEALWELFDLCRFVVEGLTEFLTGYVLFSERGRTKRECYENWVSARYEACRITYRDYVRVFGALAQLVVPLRELARIFFYEEGLDVIRWWQRYEEFLHTYGLPDFLRLATEHPTHFELAGHIAEALSKHHGQRCAKKFKALINEAADSEVLDYSRMMLH